MSASHGRVSLSAQIILAMLLGTAVGLSFGVDAAPLGDLGKTVIQLIKIIAAPLLFLSILSAILRTEVEGRAALRMLAVAGFNGCLALAIGLGFSNVVQPGHHLRIDQLQGTLPRAGAAIPPKDVEVSLSRFINGLVPESLVHPFTENVVLTLVFLALLLGFSLRSVRAKRPAGSPPMVAEQLIAEGLAVFELVLRWVVQLVPAAVFGVVARSTGEYGLKPLSGLAVYVLVGLSGLATQILIVYQVWIVWFARIPLRRFWAAAREPVTYALGANSSLATLPVTLAALRKLKVSESASTLGACVGTNFNNDGIILYEAMAALLVAQASGIDLSVWQQLSVAGTCLIAAAGIAGVPEAGFVSLALVLQGAHLPTELLPILLTVDWIVARARSVTNVLSDMVVSVALNRMEEKAAGGHAQAS